MKTTDKKTCDKWRPFEEARIFVHTLGLRNKDEWAIWAKNNNRSHDIPAGPSRVYKNKGGKGW